MSDITLAEVAEQVRAKLNIETPPLGVSNIPVMAKAMCLIARDVNTSAYTGRPFDVIERDAALVLYAALNGLASL